tara:strand:- start:538 stop:702 length:165 start_codon:yes stop_codon:yes gene_type:complete
VFLSNGSAYLRAVSFACILVIDTKAIFSFSPADKKQKKPVSQGRNTGFIKTINY